MADRLTLSEALQIVAKIVGLYPNGGSQASKGYLGGLAAILVTYPRTIAQQSADPIKGVPRECKFLPTPADLIAWCERETASLRRPVDVDDHYATLRQRSEYLRAEGEYWQKARAKRPTLDELRIKHGPNWGLRDPLKPQRKVKAWDQQAPDWPDITISPQLKAIIMEWADQETTA